MSKEKRKQILFSCLGSTDPVRGLHDGAMLHIARHYRPEKIFWYITKEMRLKEAQDDRYRLSIRHLEEQCPGYTPEILEPYYDEQEDASDFDGFYQPFSEIFRKLTQAYPEAEILVNLSSGTPQMKMTLALLAENLQYRVRTVQVKNFEKRSGTSERTTSQNYDLEVELGLNEDAEPEAENRCSEPKLLGLQREKLRNQVGTLLQRYDYEALLSFAGSLPEKVLPLIRHLAFRSAYDRPQAEQWAKEVRGMELYPAMEKDGATYPEYRALSEYLLTLKLMQRTQRYTDLVIRLNPLVIRMQVAWLSGHGASFSDWGYQKNAGEWIMQREQIGQTEPELLRALDTHFCLSGGFRSGPLNIIFCNRVMEWLGLSDTETGRLFLSLEKLNAICRNNSAHKLTSISESEIQAMTGLGGPELLKRLFAVLRETYPQHDTEELYGIYEKANRAILKAL